jgi:DNA-binding NarL/FixJ family response regulator
VLETRARATDPESLGHVAGEAFGPGSRLRVLVVEDDRRIQRSFSQRLERAHFDVTVASTIAEARGLLDQDGAIFEVAVLDFDLPDGDSFELVTALLERKPLCRSLVVTGRAREAEAHKYMQLGAQGFLSKPIVPGELVKAVIQTAFATLEWRHRTGQPLGQQGGLAEPPVIPLDLGAIMNRLTHIADLSPVQTTVAYRMLWGDSDREIAQMLGCAERTAKRHVGQILKKTGARTRSGLLAVLLRDAGIDDAED